MTIRSLFILLTGVVAFCTAFSSDKSATWTAEELATANTAKNCRYMDTTEQAVIMYSNLARLYPKKFMQIEVTPYFGTVENPQQYANSENRRSLMRDLNAMKPVVAFQPDSILTDWATCFQKELGESGNTGHKRVKCTEDYSAENCSFGITRPKEIVMQLLIDEGVASLGHRKNLLNGDYSRVGVAFGDHKKYRKCTVMDFK